MIWSGRTVLVTGAGGFIGSHLTERLVALGARPRALIHYNSVGSRGWLDASAVAADVEYVQGDVCDRETLARAMKGVDTVFHLAALIAIPYSYRAPASYVRTNVEGTMNVLQTALEAGVRRVVHTSTSEVYGSARRVPIDEAHPLQAQSPYSATKIGADMLAEAFRRSFDLQVGVLRPFNTFGPRQSARAVIPTIISQALAGGSIRLGRLDTTRDFTYVLDTVDGFVRMGDVTDLPDGPVHTGTGVETTIRDVAARVLAIVGRDLPVVTDDERLRPDESEVDRLCADPSRARALLGWSPGHSLDEGLRHTIAWIQAHPEHFRTGVYGI
jgi:dTDP-glucose 4,6-dehydratase